VDASKPSEGYADSIFTFYDTPQTDTSQRYVKISAGQETKNVVIRIGPRCATLHLDIIGKNGKLIPVQLAFTRPDIPGPYITSVPAGGDILVPPVPFKMTIKAPGYEDYDYSQTSDRQGWMHLKSGDSIHVSVSMRSN